MAHTSAHTDHTFWCCKGALASTHKGRNSDGEDRPHIVGPLTTVQNTCDLMPSFPVLHLPIAL